MIPLPSCLALALFLAADGTPVSRVRPRLVLLVSIDQFRLDYLTNHRDLLVDPGNRGCDHGYGFRYFMEDGAYFTDAHHDHYPLVTAVGHSVLLTGALPYKSGIIGNDWYDRDAGVHRYCVKDPTPVSAEHVSPNALLVTTVGDELAMATGGRAKVWSLALKDRAAVLMAGRLKHHHVLWFSESSGRWRTSDYYPSVPEWLKEWELRPEHAASQHFLSDRVEERTWRSIEALDPVLPRQDDVDSLSIYEIWNRSDLERTTHNGYRRLPNRITDQGHFAYDLRQVANAVDDDGRLTEDYYKAFETTPFASDLVFDTALEIVRREKLGADAIPDLLAINLATNDYVGHEFGPQSDEVIDAALRTDRQLAGFLGAVAAEVGGMSSLLVVVTADHGVGLNSTLAARDGLYAGSYPDDDIIKEEKYGVHRVASDEIVMSPIRRGVEAALDEELGPDDWTEFFVENDLYLNRRTLARHPEVSEERIEQRACRALETIPGVYAAYGRRQILEGRLPQTDIAKRVMRSFHPRISGDVCVVFDPGWSPQFYEISVDAKGAEKGGGATHGSPYSYDTHVPLFIAGDGIAPGRYAGRVSTLDIAPTLSDLLDIAPPSGSEGRVLTEAIAPTEHRALSPLAEKPSDEIKTPKNP